jgi:nitronate monooxygenase
MPLQTRLTARLGIERPIISAPMGFVAGGRLAAAVSNAGGLGLIGGGYGDPDWLDREFEAAGNALVGCGFITWSLARRPELLDQVLARRPAALMLSFGSPAPFAETIKRSGSLLMCQVQSVRHAEAAVAAGADILVAQGGEAGGHSGSRSTFTLVPEVADLLSRVAPETLLIAAGGIADGRGLAAALMLGADGVSIGSRLVASSEATAPKGFQNAILAANGDATIKTTVIDTVRGLDWPGDEFEVRAIKNQFTDTWHGRDSALADPSTYQVQNGLYWEAFRAGDAENAGVLIGEAVGLIHQVEPVSQILTDMVDQARQLLAGVSRHVVP